MEKKNLIYTILAALVFAWLLYQWFGPCEDPGSDQDQIRRLIDRCVSLVEQHKLSELMDLTTEDFIASPRSHDRRSVKRYLFVFFNRYKNFKMVYPNPPIELQPDTQTATAKLSLLIVRQGEDLPDTGDLIDDPEKFAEEFADMANFYRLFLSLRKVDDEWLISQATLVRFKVF
jgi:hypothetical protein